MPCKPSAEPCQESPGPSEPTPSQSLAYARSPPPIVQSLLIGRLWQCGLGFFDEVILFGYDPSAGFLFQLAAGVAGDGAAFAGGGLVGGEALRVFVAGDFGGGG